MSRRLPIVPTIVVAAAVALMIGLGVWQLQRARWKEGLLSRYAQADELPPISWPTVPVKRDTLPLFRHATGMCVEADRSARRRRREPLRRARLCPHHRLRDGRRRAGHERRSRLVEEPQREGQLARRPGQRRDRARPAHGHAAGRRQRSAGTGAERSADARKHLPNNHRFYALQWFAFAAIALVIYGLALRKRWRKEAKP